MTEAAASAPRSAWREKLRVVIFEADTAAGKAFDVGLLVAIVVSVASVMLESVAAIRASWGFALDAVEWILTILFTVEYLLRLAVVPRPLAYARSFFGVIDLLAVLPTYASLLVPGAESLVVIRALRLLRIFRVFKLGRFIGEMAILTSALAKSRHKVSVFLGTVVILMTILGTVMYLIEGEEHGFTSIPVSIYWAIVTMTTVGYGDVVPQTVAGKMLASLAMILGYSILAVPTGIVTAEIVEAAKGSRERPTTRTCPACLSEGHSSSARFCLDCGAALPRYGAAAEPSPNRSPPS
ncbi:MAG: ion transporter [Candidatus Binatia bacterium]